MVVFWAVFGTPLRPLKNGQKPQKTPKNTPFFGSDGWGPVKTQNRRFFEKSLHMSTIIILAKMPKIAKNCPFWAPSGAISGGPENEPKTTIFTLFDELIKSLFLRLSTLTLASSTQSMWLQTKTITSCVNYVNFLLFRARVLKTTVFWALPLTRCGSARC